jgi:hypothetical protein
MQNFSFDSNKAGLINQNLLLQEIRRKSLGNLGSLNYDQQNENRAQSFNTFMFDQNNNNNNKVDLVEHLQQQNRFSSILMSMNNDLNNNNIYFQQQQQQQLNQEKLSNFFTNYANMNLSNICASSNQNNEFLNSQLNRRKSYGPVASSPLLKPVYESRSTSPVFSFPNQQKALKQQHQQQALSTDKNYHQIPASQNKLTRTTSSNFNLQPNQRFRASSLGNVDVTLPGQSQSNLSSVLSNFSNLKFSDSSLEEKLATTGNIFQRRDDWSILSKLPVEKQNTIHIRLEDEGPYGNDETRCFLLSHLSSLGIRELDCVFCESKLIVYDRFPLIDGTLFASPFVYNKLSQIPATVSGKHQYIYGICIKCLNGSDPEHEIKCKYCNESWQNIAKFSKSIQIGTFYKYDLIAANPCCQMRVTCKSCKHPLTDLSLGGLPYFSSYSEKKKCDFCLKEDFHFIKNLSEIYCCK